MEPARTDGGRARPPVLAARGLVRSFGAVRAVDGVDLSLEEGDVLTVFGPNGAGKSTLLGLLAGGLRPDRGEVRFRGELLDFGAVEWRSRLGVVSHQGFLYADLTVEENLRFYGELFGVDGLDGKIGERLDRVGLARWRDTRVRQLSHGMRQRLALARALLHDPDVVLLDEPYSGLDPTAAGILRDVLAELRDGRRTVVMVTHNLSQGLELATHVAVMVAGCFAWRAARSVVDADRFEHRYHEIVEGRS